VRTLSSLGGPYARTETFPIAWGDSGLEAIGEALSDPEGADRTAGALPSSCSQLLT